MARSKTSGQGRPKGALNKITRETKDALAVFVSNNTDLLDQWIRQVEDPAKRIDLILRAMEYVRPKLQRQTIEGDDDKPLRMQIEWQNKPSA